MKAMLPKFFLNLSASNKDFFLAIFIFPYNQEYKLKLNVNTKQFNVNEFFKGIFFFQKIEFKLMTFTQL